MKKAGLTVLGVAGACAAFDTNMMRLLVSLALCGLFVPAGAAEFRTESLARSLGVQLQSGYASSRSKLLRASWKADSAWGESDDRPQRAYPQYPEVLCGQGYDAVCTGRFEKADQAILLTIDRRTSTLRVTSVDQD